MDNHRPKHTELNKGADGHAKKKHPNAPLCKHNEPLMRQTDRQTDLCSSLISFIFHMKLMFRWHDYTSKYKKVKTRIARIWSTTSFSFTFWWHFKIICKNIASGKIAFALPPDTNHFQPGIISSSLQKTTLHSGAPSRITCLYLKSEFHAPLSLSASRCRPLFGLSTHLYSGN